MGTKTQKQRKCCYHNLNAKQLMSESVHRKLLMLAAKTGRKKVDSSADVVGGWIEEGGRIKVIVLAPSR